MTQLVHMFDYLHCSLCQTRILFESNRYLSCPAFMSIHNDLSQSLPVYSETLFICFSSFLESLLNSFDIILTDSQQSMPSAKTPVILICIIPSNAILVRFM